MDGRAAEVVDCERADAVRYQRHRPVTAAAAQPGPSPAGARYAGRVALVTASSRGIGLAIAERLVAEGGQVCVTARKPEHLAEAVQQLGGPERAIGVPGRADDRDHQEAAVAATVAAFGRLDVLVNNVGINPVYGSLDQLDTAVAAKVFAVNVVAALDWTTRARAAGLGRHDGAAVVNVASVAGLHPADGIGLYGVSKAALIQLTRQLAWELAPEIRVNAVAPAVVKTRFATALYEGREEQVSASYPLRRLGRPEDVAAAVAFLAGDDGSWVTGQVLTIDGGLGLGGGVA